MLFLKWMGSVTCQRYEGYLSKVDTAQLDRDRKRYGQIEAVKGMQVDNMDGIKVYEPDGWVQVLPDPDEPVFHVYAEGESLEDSHRLE